MIKRFFEFSNEYILNENLSQAKTFLKNQYLSIKKLTYKDIKSDFDDFDDFDDSFYKYGISEEEYEDLININDINDVKLNKEEIYKVLNNVYFKKIVNMLRSNRGYIYLFTKLFFEDIAPGSITGVENENYDQGIEDLKSLLGNINRFKQSLGDLPMPIDRYVSNKAKNEELQKSKEEGRPYREPYERLVDDLEDLETKSLIRKWVSNLNSKQKSWFKDTSKFEDRLEQIVMSFNQFGDGNDKIRKRKWDNFFKTVSSHQNLDSLLDFAESYIKSDVAGLGEFLLKIEEVNDKYGEIHGAEVVLLKGSILVIRVKSFSANRDLNSNTRHCIARTQSMWNHYLDKYSRQYYIYDFNRTDNMSVIGFTVKNQGKGEYWGKHTTHHEVESCHLKNDAYYSKEKLKDYLNSLGIDIKSFKGASDEEIEMMEKREEGHNMMSNPGISLDGLKMFIEEYDCDPNYDDGIALKNATKSESIDKIEYLLQNGADPNIGYHINLTDDVDIIKLYLKYGAELTLNTVGKLFKLDEDEIIEFLKKYKVDVNSGNGFILRVAVTTNSKKVAKYLLDNGADISFRRYKAVKQAVVSENEEMFEILIKGSKSDLPDDHKEFLIKMVEISGAKPDFYVKLIKEK